MKRLIGSYNIPTIIRAIRLLGRRKALLVGLILGFCAVEISMSILTSSGLRGAINALGGREWSVLAKNVAIFAAGNAMWWIYAPISSYGCALASKGAIQQLKADLCDRITLLPMSETDRRSNGELLSVLTNDLDSLARIYDWYFFQLLHTSLGGVAGIVIMALLDWRFAIVVFALGSVSVLVSAGFNRRLEQRGEVLQHTLARTGGVAYALIKGAKTLRLSRMQEAAAVRIEDAVQLEAVARLDSGRLTAGLSAAVSAVSACTYAVMLAAGAAFVCLGLSDWGSVAALMGLKVTTDMLFVEFGQFMAGTQTCVAGVLRVLSLLDAPIESDAPAGVVITPSDAPLRLENISFAYKDTPVLSGFSLELRRRGLTVLIGESGSGKSTVVKLALGLYSPQSGAIVFDGAESRTKNTVRSKTAYVPQEPMLLRDTVMNNILSGSAEASRDDAVRAARAAGADVFISRLPGGYDTPLTDDGKNLSGGQKQRIAIARALVKDAPILLLDEITSALDDEAERQVLETVKELAKSRAVLFVTHKQSVIDVADAVYQI